MQTLLYTFRKGLFFTLIFLSAISLFANKGKQQPGPTELIYGDDISAILAPFTIDTFTFEGVAGDKIIIQANGHSSNFDVHLRILSPDNTQLDIEVSSGDMARIDQFLVQSGVHRILLKEAGNNFAGPYSLSLEKIGSTQNTILFDCSYNSSDSIEKFAEIDAYAFTAEAGDQIIIQMNSLSSAFASRLELYNPDGSLLELEVSNGGLVGFGPLLLNQSGLYSLFVMEEDGDHTGSYDLSLQYFNPLCASPITCDESISVSTAFMTQLDIYTFETTGDEQVIIQMNGNSSSFDSRIELYEPNGNLMTLEVSSGSLSRIGPIHLAQAGIYSLVVSEGGGDQVGNYNLSIGSFQSPCTKQVVCNEDLTAPFDDPTQIDVYTFSANNGEQIIIQMNGLNSSFDVRMELYSPTGELVELELSDDNLARIGPLKLLQEGTYILIVMEDGADDTGGYGLSVQFFQQESCTSIICDGSITGSLENRAQMEAYTFNGDAGNIIDITLSELHPSLKPRLELYAPDCSLLAMISDTVSSNINITLPETGPYTILGSDHSGNNLGDYQLDLEGCSPNAINKIVNPLLQFTTYPNPVKQFTNIDFEISRDAFIKVVIIDGRGVKLVQLTEGTLMAGQHHINWENQNFPPGIFWCQLSIEGMVINKPLIILP